MPRTISLRTTALALACICGASSLRAQSVIPVPSTLPAAEASSPVIADTTLRVRQLPAMKVTAEKAKVSREGVLALMDENRRLMGELRRQDQKVDSLSRRLAYLRGPATDSITRDIARFDAQAADTRARRQALEQRLLTLEGGGSTLMP